MTNSGSGENPNGSALFEAANKLRKLIQKLLGDQLNARWRTNNLQAKCFSDAAHRQGEHGLTEEEAAFYDALAGGVEHVKAEPNLAALAHDLAESIRMDLSVDWTDHEATEAKIRTKIKRLLRRNRDKLPRIKVASDDGAGDGTNLNDGSINRYTQLVLDHAKAMYRYWPEVGDRLFDEAS
jgi:type I restriction enzyme R subunit